jgi:beta-lactamase regulating signal transducer with metallopeptidase domain
MSPLDLAASYLVTLALHASLLLGTVWLAERSGWLRHPGLAELAWRIALLGGLLSAAVATVPWPSGREASPSTLRIAVAAPSVPQTAPGMDAMAGAAPAAPLPPRPEPTTVGTAAAVSPAGALALPEIAAALALVLWCLGLALGGLRMLWQALAVQVLAWRLRRRTLPATDGLHQINRQLAQTLAIPAPALRVWRRASSPMVLPGGCVLLPAWACQLPPGQQRALLAHELSHVARRDASWRIVHRLARLPLFFHPLAAHACRRLDDLAEDACDARAAQLMGSGRPLAECLAACLSHAGAAAGQPALAVAMAGESGTVVRRVRNLLENSAMSLTPVSPALRRTAIAAALVAAIVLPGIAVTTTTASELADSIISRMDINGRTHFSHKTTSPGHELVLDVYNTVEFNEAETDVVRLGKGARLELVEERLGVKREIKIYGKDGIIQRRYKVDGDERPLDAEGRAWLATTLPKLMRETGVNAEARSERILAKGGVPALLEEITLIQSDSARATYLGLLFANGKLDDSQMQRALSLAQDISSDYELRRALQQGLSQQALSPPRQAQLLGLAAQIGSDFERAELLISMAERVPADAALLPAWRDAVDDISSDFERRRVLEAVLASGRGSSVAALLVLELAQDISSDFELRQVLEKAARATRGDTAVLAAFVQCSREIGSDFERREALVALIKAGPVDAAVANAALDALSGISSDFESLQVLEALAATMPNDAALLARYREAARGLDDYERGQAEKALDRFA